jgi:hypothetical protein
MLPVVVPLNVTTACIPFCYTVGGFIYGMYELMPSGLLLSHTFDVLQPHRKKGNILKLDD